MPRAPAPEPTLKRSLSLPLLTLYGVGTTIGAGIYVLIGKVVGEAGVYAPLSFLLAAALAGLSALSFAEMSARFPASAGEAVYVQEGLGRRRLTVVVGLLVVAAGLVSCATLAHGFVGYMTEFVDLPDAVLLVALVGALGLIASIGITESVALAAVLTLLEVGGLVAIIGGAAFGESAAAIEITPSAGAPLIWTGVLSGAVLAFYAFIGFEDMVNVAEEVKDARRTLPRAILATLVITSAFYVAISLIAVAMVPAGLLAESDAPLALLFERTTGLAGAPISVIAILAVLNGMLIQIIMAARVLYGMGSRGWLPAVLAHVNPRTRTPLRSTALATAIVLGLALAFPIVTLAKATSAVALSIFTLVNLSLHRLKAADPAPHEGFTAPRWLPLLGALASAALLAFELGHGLLG